MPRLSVWKDGSHGTDYKFFDRIISESFTVGGTGTFIHKYLGPENGEPGNANISSDPTQPVYTTQSPSNIQDLLFMENRDRVYDTSIYRMRCIYHVPDNDLDLSQFGIMLAAGTVFINFHINDMVRILGRKLMSGDVLELPHLKDYDSLDTSVSVALQRFYVVQDGVRPSEGFSSTWWPHIWKVKCTPMVDSQEYAQILNTIVISTANGNVTLGDIISTANSSLTINDAVVEAAEQYVPNSGYNTDPLWSPLFANANPSMPIDPLASPQTMWGGYLVNEGTALDGYPVSNGINFPVNAEIGDYFLRTDFFPNRLFRFNGSAWTKVSDSQRTGLTPGTGKTQRDRFVNNPSVFVDTEGETLNSRQAISSISSLGKD